jgi:hypothetical protein
MSQVKKQLLECIIRECIREILDQTNNSTPKQSTSLSPQVAELKMSIKKIVKEAFTV